MSVKAKKPTTDEIATAQKDIFQDYIGKTLTNPDKVLKSESGGKGIELYEELLFDDKVGSTMQTRSLAVIGKEWKVLPASNKHADQKIANYVKEVFLGFNFDAARKALLQGIVTGFKPGEIMWDYSEGNVWIKDIIGKAPRRFVFDLDRQMRMLTLTNMIDGEELPDRKFVTFRNVSANGSPYGDALGRILYWPVWFKKHGLKFWLIFADKFGSPTAIGKYPPGTLPAKQRELLDAMETIQQESAITIPDNMLIEYLEAERAGSVNTYESLCNYLNKAIAQIILGQTLTSDIGSSGSLAASKSHEVIRQDYLKADADALCETLNGTVIRWLVDYNFPVVTKYPKMWIRTEPEEDLKALADRDKVIIVDMGVPVTKQYVYETYNIPEPKDGEELIKTPSPKPQAPDTEKVKESQFAEKTDWVSRYMEALAPSLQNVRTSALDTIEEWLITLGSPPSEIEFLSRIENALGASYAAIDQAAITNTVKEMYGTYRGIRAAFGGPDVRSMQFLSKLDHFYCSKFLTNPDTQATVKSFLSQTYLEKGASIFKRSNPEDLQAFKDLFGQKLADLEEWQVRRIIDTSVQRTRNWASIAQLNEARITEMVVYEPTKDCAFCRAMDGKVISVATAYNRMTSQTGMSPREYEMDMRQFPATEANIDVIVNSGRVPPYHPHCHGTVLRKVR